MPLSTQPDIFHAKKLAYYTSLNKFCQTQPRLPNLEGPTSQTLGRVPQHVAFRWAKATDLEKANNDDIGALLECLRFVH